MVVRDEPALCNSEVRSVEVTWFYWNFEECETILVSRMTCLISLVPKECLGNDFGWFPKNVWEMNLVGQKDFEFHKYHK